MDNAVKLTLRDGTRTSVPGNAIEDIEPDGRGALVRLLSGETLSATQDARMLEVRWRAAMADRNPTPAPVAVEDPRLVAETDLAKSGLADAPLPSRARRMKRLLRGRISQGAFLIGGIHRTRGKD